MIWRLWLITCNTSSRVIVRERINRVEDFLQAADLAMFSSETESFCLAILEAMCFGVPSVSTAVGGIPEVVVDGQTGLLVPYDAAEPRAFEHAFADAVNDLAADPARASAMGIAGRARAVSDFGWDAIADQTIAVYDAALRA